MRELGPEQQPNHKLALSGMAANMQMFLDFSNLIALCHTTVDMLSSLRRVLGLEEGSLKNVRPYIYIEDLSGVAANANACLKIFK